jgi:hypothetical protein
MEPKPCWVRKSRNGSTIIFVHGISAFRNPLHPNRTARAEISFGVSGPDKSDS